LKGLVIIGVTDEAESVVDKWIATKKKTGYPIAILNGELEKVLGVPHFPYAGVIDPDGKLAYAGDSPEAALKKALKSAKAGSVWPKKLMPVALFVRGGKLGEAWSDLQALKTGGSFADPDAQTAERFESFITGTASSALKSAQALAKKDYVYLAVKKAEGIAQAKPPMPASAEAQKLLDELKALPTYEAEMKGGEAFANAHAKQEAQEYIPAIDAYKELARKYSGSKIAALAIQDAQALIDAGMPGYARACEKCHKLRKACEKHAKTVKL
jgi:hypothetical protein